MDLRFETILVNLIKEAGRVTGALVKDLVKDEYYQINAKKGVILTDGNYLAFLISPEVETLKAQFQDAMK